MNNIKKVSVVMCTYNGELFLREQIDSIINQTYPVYELLIQDDCSTDQTIDIVNEYIEKYSYVRLISNPTQLGVANNFKTAFYRANGDYIAISDQDDIWLPEKISEMINSIGDNLLISSSSYLFTSQDEISTSIPEFGERLFPMRLLTLQDTLSGHDILFKRELLSFIPNSLWEKYWYDFCLGITAIGQNKIVCCKKTLTLWRRHVKAATYDEPHKKQRIWGYVNTILIACRQQNLQQATTFYKYLSPVLTNNEDAMIIASAMENKQYFKIVLFALKNRKSLVTSVSPNSFNGLLRAVFIPFFIIRNIHEWKGMYINE